MPNCKICIHLYSSVTAEGRLTCACFSSGRSWQPAAAVVKAKKRPKSGLLKAKSVGNDFRNFKAKKTSKVRPFKGQICGKWFHTFQGQKNVQSPAF